VTLTFDLSAPIPKHFRIFQVHYLYQVWTLWNHSFLGYAADKETNKPDGAKHHSYPRHADGVCHCSYNGDVSLTSCCNLLLFPESSNKTPDFIAPYPSNVTVKQLGTAVFHCHIHSVYKPHVQVASKSGRHLHLQSDVLDSRLTLTSFFMLFLSCSWRRKLAVIRCERYNINHKHNSNNTIV